MATSVPVQEFQPAQASMYEADSKKLGDVRGAKGLQKLMTRKELIIVILICLIGAGVLRLQDTISLHLTWSQRIDPFVYMNGEFPIIGEKL